MAGLEQPLEAPCGEFRSAGEEGIHGGGTRSGLARKALRQLSNDASGGFAELFLKLGLDALLLEARQIVNEDFALKVIHFVLDADRQELVCDAGEGFPSRSSARTVTRSARSTGS